MAAVVLVGVFGGFVKGKNIEVPAGTEYLTYTVGDRRLDLSAVSRQALVPTTGVVQPQAPPPPSPASYAAETSDALGAWKVTLPNTSAQVAQGPNGTLIITLEGE